MLIECFTGDLKLLVDRTKTENEKITKLLRWKQPSEPAEINVIELSKAELDVFKVILEEAGNSSALRKLKQFEKVSSNPLEASVSRLEALHLALLEYIGATPNHILFEKDPDGSMLPYFVTSINFVPAEKRQEEPAKVVMRLKAQLRGAAVEDTVTWYHADLKGKLNVVQHIDRRGYVIETPELMEIYEAEIVRYGEVKDTLGEQYKGYGQAYIERSPARYWSAKHADRAFMVRDGEPARLVMDDSVEEGKDGDATAARDRKPVYADSSAWTKWAAQKQAGKLGKSKAREDELDLDDEETQVSVPTHPYLKMYDLGKMRFVIIHVSNIKPYVYTEGLIDKLVLSDDRKELVRILIMSSSNQHEDIIRGKTGGTIVISTGEAGTGKTLTAEVFAEEMKRPLYVVQCSQLGISPDDLEKNLSIVLARATRWKAILLLDEADVYVHTRGSDVIQNAIVGVFLRVLEYYRGILFMTSNRDVIIDDAILSRGTAHIRYSLPDSEAKLKEVWTVLSTQYEIAIGPALMADLLHTFPPGSISPRNIKMMLKLVRSLTLMGKPLTFDTFRYAGKFVDLAHAEKSQMSSE